MATGCETTVNGSINAPLLEFTAVTGPCNDNGAANDFWQLNSDFDYTTKSDQCGNVQVG